MGAPLLGRQAGLAAIERALAALHGGDGAALALAGEPGIGKTRLLAELKTRADRRGYLVLEGRAGEFEDDRPYSLFVDALDDYLATGDRQFTPSNGDSDDPLRAVFPALAHLSPPPTTLLDERFRIHRSLRALLEQLARATPLVILLDDVHWADGASIGALSYLLTRPAPRRVLIAAGYRPAQLDTRLRTPLERGVMDGRATKVELGPLSRADAGLLAADALPSDVVDQLYAESGGNPFYLLELAKAAQVAINPRHRGKRSGNVPQAVLAAIEGEIAALPAAARTLLRGAAVAGEPFDIDLAAVAAATDEPDALVLLDQLVARELLRATDVPRRFEFRHPLLRRAVYHSTGPAWRISAHQRLVVTLRARGAPLAELAHHVEAAARPGDTHAIEVLATAATAVLSRAPAIAARQFAAALRLLPHEDQHTNQRIELLVPLAAALSATGQLAEARDALLQALGLLPAAMTRPRIELEVSCAALEHLLGLHTQSHTRLRAALTALPDRATPHAARLMIELSTDAIWAMDWEATRHWAHRAHRAGSAIADDPAIQAATLVALAWGELCTNAPARAIELIDAAATRFDTMTDLQIADHLDTIYYLSAAEYFLEQYERAIRHSDRALVESRNAGSGQFVIPTLGMKSSALRRLGRIQQATETSEEAIERARLVGHDQILLFALLARAWVATAAGDLERAHAVGDEGLAVSGRLQPSPITASAAWTYGEALLDTGQPDRCITTVLDAAGGSNTARLAGSERCYAWHLLVRAEIQRDRLDAAQGWAERLNTLANALTPLHMPLFHACIAEAHLLLAQHDPAGAASAALAAAQAADDIHAHLDAARARLLAGKALGAGGERRRGVELLEHAHTQLDECGAARYRDEAAHELRRLGRPVHRGGRRATAHAGIGALSDRERTIATHAAAGKTNNQIAAELFLSAKTIERHLSHIYLKLGLSSRAQLGVIVHTGMPQRRP